MSERWRSPADRLRRACHHGLLGGDGPGHDPLPGFLPAPARDPEAAAEFSAPLPVNDRVAYLMPGRARGDGIRSCPHAALRPAATGARRHGGAGPH
ncbi:hypothetical protein [Streptomyces sp. URMC 129]|uniref:hypothetical protein n=1 Tax=Streptomyces sp. URMC 129 TaxID=3423407 RepID=UPI003F1D9A05